MKEDLDGILKIQLLLNTTLDHNMMFMVDVYKRQVTDCGHFVFAKQPGQTNALIAEFLEEQRRVNAW